MSIFLSGSNRCFIALFHLNLGSVHSFVYRMPLRSLFATRRPRRVLKAIGFQVVFYASALHIISFAVPTAWPWTEQPCYVKRSNEDESAGKAMTKRRDPSDASVNDVQVSLANMTLDPATYSPVPSNASGFVGKSAL